VGRFESARSLAALAPDGKSFLTLQPRWQRWDIASGKPLYPDTARFGNQSITQVRISPDSRTIASVSGDHHLCLWDVKSGRVTSPRAPKNTAFLQGLAFTPDSKRLVCACWSGNSQGFVVVRDLPEGKIATRFRVAHIPASVAVTPDGKKIVVACWKSATSSVEQSESYILRYDLASGRELARAKSSQRYAVTELSRDGRKAVVLGKMFNIGQGEEGPAIIPDKKFFWISAHTALSADGRYYAIHALPQP